MQKQAAVIEQFVIRTRGEWHYFQVRVPRDAQAVIGIEKGIRIGDTVPANPAPSTLLQSLDPAYPRTAGEIRLLQAGGGGIVYEGNVTAWDESPRMADVGSLDFFPSHNWSHQGKMHEDPVLLDNRCHLLMGSYHDVLGYGFGQDITYSVSVCVWYERKEVWS